jgi:hypothetical protein
MTVSKYLTRKQAADFLTEELGLPITHKTLTKVASVGGGPQYQLFGKYAVYTPSNLTTWAMAKLSAVRGSTSEAV